MMGIGNMRHRITILDKIPAITENGFSEDRYEPLGTYWAEVKLLSARESEKIQTTQQEVRLKFRTRTIPGLLPSMEILFSGERYQIISTDALTFENRYMEIIGEKVTQSG